MLNLTEAIDPTHKDLTTAIIRDPITVSPKITAREAIALMSGARSHCEVNSTAQLESNSVQTEARASCVVVVESRRVVGIFTERDVVCLCAKQQSLDGLLISQVMTASVLPLRESAFTELFSAINLLQQNHIRHLPIVDEQDCLVGLVTHETLQQVLQPSDLLRLRLVREVMTQAVIMTDLTDSLLSVAQRIASHCVSSVVVVKRDRPEDLPVPIGIVTERDLVQFQALALDFECYHAAQIMSSPVITVPEAEPLITVQQLMERHSIRRVLVTGTAGELRGIVTQTDVLQALSPPELYKLTEVLEARVKQLEIEKITLLKTHNLQLEEDIASRTANLQKQLQREKIIADLATQIRFSLSLQTILDTAVEKIHQAIGCDRVNIWKFEPDLSAVVVAEATDSPQALMGERVWDECYQQHITEVYREGYVRVVPDIYTTEMTACHRELLMRLQTRAKVLLPLFCGEQLWGLLNVSESQTVRNWQADEIDLLHQFGTQLTIAIQQASVYEQLQSELQKRQQTVQALETLNAELEARVTQRTAELAERETILQDFLDNANDLIQMVDIDTGRFKFVNRSWQNVLGYTAAEVEQLTCFDVLAPEYHPYCQSVFAQMRSGSITHLEQIELTFVCKSGQQVVVEGNVNCRVATEADGSQRPVSTRGIFRDITVRKAAEQELQRREARYRGLMEGAADAILLADLQGNILEANQKAEVLLGYPVAELTTLHFTQLHPPEELPKIAAFFTELLQRQHIPLEADVIIFQRRDGSIVPVEVTSTVIEINGETLVQGIFRDITDRKRYETALQESQQFLQTVLDTVPLAVFWKDRASTYLGANRLFLQDAGLSSSSELVGKTDFDLPWRATEAEAYRADDRIVMDSDAAKLSIIEPQHQQDGTEIWLETNKLPLHNLAGEVVGILGTYQDITERQNAELSVQRQLAAIEAAINGIAILQDGRYLYLNSSHVKMFGYESAEDLIDQNWQVLYSPEERERFEQEIFPGLLEHRSWQGEAIATRKDGTTFPEQLSLTLTTDNLLICVCEDISERKQAEAALQESEWRYATLAQAAPVAIFRFDLEGHCIYVNERWCEMTGKPIAFALGDRWIETIHPDDRDHSQAATQQWLESGAVTMFQHEARILRDDGSIVWYYCQILLETDTNGNPLGYVGTLTDISDRKAAELALQDSETRFRRVFASNVVGMMFTDFSGQITDANDRFLDIIGYSRADLEANRINWAQITPPEYVEADQHAIAQLQRYGEILPWEKEYLRLDGSRISVLIGVALLSKIDGRCVCVVLDISDRKTAEAELRRTNAELERATRLKDEFLANMSHELRTPLNAIMGMTEGLQDEVFGIVNERQLKALHTVEGSANHLLSLINDILDVAKIESGQVKLDCSPVSVEQLCSSSLALIKQQALKKCIQLKTQIPPHLPALFVDEIRMRQALLNLLTNAVKFTLEGGAVTLTVSLFPLAKDTPQPTHLRISITDTGIGIAPENISKLFKPFVQIDGALNRQQTGTGLGLALVKQIVELHGGKVGLTSELGVGSCVTIDLPYEVNVPPTNTPTSLSAATGSNLSSTHSGNLPIQSPLILIAEDNPENVATLFSYFEAKGYRFLLANNGQEAINLAMSHRPDVILMDIQMPGMDGLEAIQKIRQQESLRKTPIIALTALAMEGDRERCFAAGADNYLSKPVKLKQLDISIKELLSDRSPE